MLKIVLQIVCFEVSMENANSKLYLQSVIVFLSEDYILIGDLILSSIYYEDAILFIRIDIYIG